MSGKIVECYHLLVCFILFGLGVTSSQLSFWFAPSPSAVCLAITLIAALGVSGLMAVNCPFHPSISPLNFGMGVGKGRELDIWITSRIRGGGGAYGPNVWICSYKSALSSFISNPSLLEKIKSKIKSATHFPDSILSILQPSNKVHPFSSPHRNHLSSYQTFHPHHPLILFTLQRQKRL